MVIQPGGASVGTALTANTTSSSTNIPTLANGSRPKWVYVAFSDCSNTITTGGIRFGVGTVAAATAANTMGLGQHFGIIVNVAGQEDYTAIADAACTISVTPLAGIVAGG